MKKLMLILGLVSMAVTASAEEPPPPTKILTFKDVVRSLAAAKVGEKQYRVSFWRRGSYYRSELGSEVLTCLEKSLSALKVVAIEAEPRTLKILKCTLEPKD